MSYMWDKRRGERQGRKEKRKKVYLIVELLYFYERSARRLSSLRTGNKGSKSPPRLRSRSRGDWNAAGEMSKDLL